MQSLWTGVWTKMTKISLKVFFINRNVFIDVFADYLYQPVNFETHVDIGGFKIGAGMGIKF
jgi:hypothetical protein